MAFSRPLKDDRLSFPLYRSLSRCLLTALLGRSFDQHVKQDRNIRLESVLNRCCGFRICLVNLKSVWNCPSAFISLGKLKIRSNLLLWFPIHFLKTMASVHARGHDSYVPTAPAEEDQRDNGYCWASCHTSRCFLHPVPLMVSDTSRIINWK